VLAEKNKADADLILLKEADNSLLINEYDLADNIKN